MAIIAGLAALAIALIAGTHRKAGTSAAVNTASSSTTAKQAPKAGATTTTAPPETLDVKPAKVALPSAVSRAAAVTDGSSILVLGGLPPTHQTTTKNVRLDPAAGTNAPAGDLAVATHDAAAVRLNGSVFVFGGGAATVGDAVQAVDASGSTHVVGHLPTPRADLRSVVVGDRAVIVGGYDGHTSLATVLATTDGTHFSVIATLPRAVRYPALAVVGQKVYVFGGEEGTTPVADVQVIDLSGPSATATRVGALPEPRGEAVTVTSGDRVWIAGGRTPSGIVGSVVRWDTTASTAAPGGSLPSPVADAVAVTIDRTTYLVGGENTAAVSSVFAAEPR